jgi:2-dehydropantoate 2-reductase
MRIGIVGAGAMGSLFGGLLASAGHETWFVDVWREHVETIERDGLLMTFGDQQRRVSGHGTTDPAAAGAVDLMMVWAKSFATAAALDSAAPLLGSETVVCTLQNGLGNVETIEQRVDARRIVRGVTGIGARTVGPGHIELTAGAWSGGSMTWIGGPPAATVAPILGGAGIAIEVRDDIDAIIWNKLAMSTSMASLAALLRVGSTQMLDTPDARELLAEMTREIVAVANAKGIALDAETALERNFEVYETSRGHHPSMLQDVLAGRPTEIDAMCGAVARAGAACGVPTPVNATVLRLVRALESNYDAVLGSAGT